MNVSRNLKYKNIMEQVLLTSPDPQLHPQFHGSGKIKEDVSTLENSQIH